MRRTIRSGKFIMLVVAVALLPRCRGQPPSGQSPAAMQMQVTLSEAEIERRVNSAISTSGRGVAADFHRTKSKPVPLASAAAGAARGFKCLFVNMLESHCAIVQGLEVVSGQ